MKKLHLAAAALVAIAAGAAQAQVSVGASVNINVPGVYGRVDIGAPGVAYVAPPVVYAQPVVIEPTPVAVQQRPIYLYVPVEHQRDWRHHCGYYHACGQPVYFVKEEWVHDRYVNQLLAGQFRDETRGELVALITRLKKERDADGVILGGTELPLLLTTPTIADLPVLDTTELHVAAIVERLRS